MDATMTKMWHCIEVILLLLYVLPPLTSTQNLIDVSITASCPAIISNKDFDGYQIGQHYGWRVATSDVTQRLLISVEYHGSPSLNSRLLLLGDSMGTNVQPSLINIQPAIGARAGIFCLNESLNIYAAGIASSPVTVPPLSVLRTSLFQTCDSSIVSAPNFLLGGVNTNALLVDYQLLTQVSYPAAFTITIWPLNSQPTSPPPPPPPPPTLPTTKPTTTPTTTTTTPAPLPCGIAPSNSPYLSTVAKYPWLVQLRYQSTVGGAYNYACAGVLVAPNWVMSALHCFFPNKNNANQWIVVSGASSISTSTNSGGVISSSVSSIVWPSAIGTAAQLNLRYSPSRNGDDIVLIQLQTPFKNIAPICLPPANWTLVPSTSCVMATWQSTASSAYRGTLQDGSLQLINWSTCNSNQWLDGQLQSDQLCAAITAAQGTDPCVEDGGTPLICTGANRGYEVVGIASWLSSTCGRVRSPSVYTAVIAYRSWIVSTISTSQQT